MHTTFDTILVGYTTVRGRLHIGILALRRDSHETTSCLYLLLISGSVYADWVSDSIIDQAGMTGYVMYQLRQYTPQRKAGEDVGINRLRDHTDRGRPLAFVGKLAM